MRKNSLNLQNLDKIRAMNKKELVKALKERNLDWSTGKQLELMERLLEAAEVEYQERLSKAAGKITEPEASMNEERFFP